MSRVAIQAVCKGLYQHEFYLSKDEAIEKNPALSKYKEEQENSKPNKRENKELSAKLTPLSNKEYVLYECFTIVKNH